MTSTYEEAGPPPYDDYTPPDDGSGVNREPPQDARAEQAVLGSMLLSKNAIGDVIARVEPGDFYLPAHQSIYSAIFDMYGRGEPVDPVTVAAELDARKQLRPIGGAPYLLTLIETVPTAVNADYYAGIVAEKSDLRGLIQAGRRIVQCGYTGAEGSDIAEVIRSAEQEINRVASVRRASRDDDVVDGAAFILGAPAQIPALWGRGDEVLWAEGESLMIGGGQGLCKTTLAGLLVRGLLGLTLPNDQLLGLPVAPIDGNILYLAMDRANQIARSLRRQFTDDDDETLRTRMIVRPGPPEADMAKNPTLLVDIARRYDARVVFVDSVKDAAIGLSDDEVGASYNRARQHLLHDGRQICDLHHVTKAGADTINDIYGSTWLTSGCGSVILLNGNPGDPIIGFKHAKAPASEVGPLTILHDQDSGQLDLYYNIDIVNLVKATRADGLTAKAAAMAMFSSDQPDRNQIQKARRTLDKKTAAGVLVKKEGAKGGRDGGTETRWYLAAN